MNTPRASIVMPVWGARHGAHLVSSLPSLAAQKAPLSLVLVEDGPVEDDAGHDAIERHRGLLRHIVVHQENLGTASAINSGVEHLDRGAPYWSWVQADCVYQPNWLRNQIAFLDTNPDCAMVYSNYIRENGRMLHGTWTPYGQSLGRFPRSTWSTLVDSPYCPIGPAFLFRRHVAEEVGEHRGQTAHDFDWFLRFEEVCLAKGWTIDHLDESLCTYRVHPDRASEALRHKFDGDHWQAEARKRRAL